MKPIRTLAAAVLAGLMSLQTAGAAEIKPLNSIAIEINSSIITYRDIERVVREFKSRPGNKDIPEAQLVQAAKNTLVERALLADAARAQDLKATPAGIDAELERRAAAGKTTVQNIYAQAAALGYTREAYRTEVAKDLLITYMLQNLNSNIKITDDQVQAALNELQAKGQAPAGEPYTVYTIRRVILNAANQQHMPAVGQRIQQIATAIAQGSDFGAVAQRYSQEVQAANQGLHDNITDMMLPENVETALHQLQPGQITPPLRAGNSWQIVQLIGARTENDPAKMQREAVRRMLVRQAQERNQAQFMAQLQQMAVVREY